MPGGAVVAEAVDDADPAADAATGALARVSNQLPRESAVRQPTTSTYEKSPTGGGGFGLPGSTRMASSASAASSCEPAGNPFSFNTCATMSRYTLSPRLAGALRGIVVAIFVKRVFRSLSANIRANRSALS